LKTISIRALVEHAIESGDIRRDLDPLDLLRALLGVSNVACGPDWQQSARRLVDILINGSRPVKIKRTPMIIPEFSAGTADIDAHNCWGCLLAKRCLESSGLVGEISIEKRASRRICWRRGRLLITNRGTPTTDPFRAADNRR
jgi:hypothetical protein